MIKLTKEQIYKFHDNLSFQFLLQLELLITFLQFFLFDNIKERCLKKNLSKPITT